MAMIKCHECGAPVSTEANACPGCGAKPRKPLGAGAIIGLVAVGWLAYAVTTAGSNPSSPRQAAQPTPQDNLRTAKYACEGFVKKALHDPDSAQFEPFYENAAAALPGDDFEVVVQLRARNGFGGMRKVAMNCRVHRSGDNWTLVSLDERK